MLLAGVQQFQPPVVSVPYTIAGSSDHSGQYVAENILVDSPMNQSSRWSGAYPSGTKQWILLKLEQLCVLKSITFGKYHKAHPCNVKELKVYVGQTPDGMNEVLHTGLKNDSIPETFAIKHVNSAGMLFPTQYVKIVPISAHGPSFHTSIWYVALSGIVEPAFIERVKMQYQEYQETHVLKHILKYLRQRRLLTPYRDILSLAFSSSSPSMSNPFEHHILTQLHNAFVLRGDYSEAEALLSACATQNLFSEAVLGIQPTSEWTRLDSESITPENDRPIARGGHSMCIDRKNGLIYMFGGWDGHNSLGDFWVYNISTNKWKEIVSNPGDVKPGPRSCHKLVLDDATGDIYMLGRLDEGTSADSPALQTVVIPRSPTPPQGSSADLARSPTPVALPNLEETWNARYKAEFFRYRSELGMDGGGKWELLSADTASEGGPPLVFDHQMVMDSDTQTIYVHGGRVVDGDWDTIKYSGLFSYDCRTRKWTKFYTPDVSSNHPSIPSRFGHSMILDPNSKVLFIFGGQRDDTYLSDMYTIHIPSRTVTELFSNFTAQGGPDACFTQRAVLDPTLKEIYILCGLTKGPGGSMSILEKDSPYWIYRYKRPEQPGKWIRILKASSPSIPGPSAQCSSTAPPSVGSPEAVVHVPRPRYAHQIAYDIRTKTIYMHGGNAGLGIEKDENELNLSDRDADGHSNGEDISRLHQGGSAASGSSRDHIRGESGGMEMVNEPTGGDGEESRLDDLWSLRLKRPAPEDIVRRGKYLLRQQRFRELCEDSPPVQALTYLQAEVSAVVDHSDSEEATTFRALLSHLLTPAAPSKTTGNITFASTERSTTLPEEDDPMDGASTSKAAIPERTSPVLRLFEEDPEEIKAGGGAQVPSPERYKQRTEVFEGILKMVNEDAKQPDRSLLDIIKADCGEDDTWN